MEDFQERYGGQLSLQDVRSDSRKVCPLDENIEHVSKINILSNYLT